MSANLFEEIKTYVKILRKRHNQKVRRRGEEPTMTILTNDVRTNLLLRSAESDQSESALLSRVCFTEYLGKIRQKFNQSL